jgi:hypothetical protein
MDDPSYVLVDRLMKLASYGRKLGISPRPNFAGQVNTLFLIFTKCCNLCPIISISSQFNEITSFSFQFIIFSETGFEEKV